MPRNAKPGSEDAPASGAAEEARKNRRTEHREDRDDPVRVFINDPAGGALIIGGELENLSDRGALIRARDSLKPGQECLVTIIGPAGDAVIDAAFARVRWACIGDHDDFLMGIEYAEPRTRTMSAEGDG